MEEDLDKIMNRNNYFLVKYGMLLIIIVFIATLIAMSYLMIEGKSILQLAFEYYVR
jgi:hypothetical protein